LEIHVRVRHIAAGLLAGVLVFTACGSSKKAVTTTTASSASATTAAAGGLTATGKIDNCDVYGTKGSIPFTPTSSGTLSLQTSLPAPGWFNGDTAAGVKDGYEYCMGAEIAWLGGLDKVTLTNVDFDQLVAAGTKSFDLALAEISITDKRKQVVDFSTPYFASDIGVIVKKDTTVTSTADLKKLSIGVQQGTTGADFATKNIAPNAKVFPDSASMFAALDAGSVQAVMTDTSIVQQQEKQSNGAEVVVGQYKTGESYGALYPKGSANEDAFNKAIQYMIDNKILSKLSITYLSGDPTTVPYFTV
jgi:polar amino acid transport system substrate-binding protein